MQIDMYISGCKLDSRKTNIVPVKMNDENGKSIIVGEVAKIHREEKPGVFYVSAIIFPEYKDFVIKAMIKEQDALTNNKIL